MLLAELLLERQEIAPRLVERSRNNTLVGPADDSSDRKAPACRADAGRIEGHGAKHIIRVGVADRAVEARCEITAHRVDVRRSSDIAESVVRRCHVKRVCAVAEHSVHAAQRRIIESAAGKVVHRNSIDIRRVKIVVVTAVAETHDREVVVGGGIVDVVRRTVQNSYRLRDALFIFKNRFVKQ